MSEKEHVQWVVLEPDPMEAGAKRKAITISIVVDLIALIAVGYGLFILQDDSLGSLRYVLLALLAAMAFLQISFLSHTFSPIIRPLVVYSDGIAPPRGMLSRFLGVPEFIRKEDIESLELVIFRFKDDRDRRTAEMMKSNPRMKLRAKLKGGKRIGLAERRPDVIRSLTDQLASTWGTAVVETFIDV